MKETPIDPHFRERITASFERQRFMKTIGARLSVVEAGFCEITLPFSEDLTQQHGFFHAGVVGTLADNAAGYAAFSLMPADASILTAEFKLNLLTPAAGEWLISRGTVLRSGATLTVCRSEVYAVKDGTEKLCAASQSTLICLRGKADSA